MSFFKQAVQPPRLQGYQPALCSLPLNGDGRRLRLTKITIIVKFCSLSFLVSGIFTCTGGARLTIGNCSSRQLLWEQRYNGASSLSTVQSVAPYCAAQMKAGQWKAGLQSDSIWLICSETKQTTDANRCRSALSIKGHWVKCFLIM